MKIFEKMCSGTPWCRDLPPAGAVEISLEITVAGPQVLGATALPDQYTDQCSDCCDQTELHGVDLDGTDDDHAGCGSEDDPLQQVVEEPLDGLGLSQLSLLLFRYGSKSLSGP